MLLQYTGSKSLYTNAHKIGKIPHIVKYNFSCTLYRSSSCRMTFLDDCLCGSRCIIVTSNHEPSTDHTLLSPASWVMYAKSIHIGYILTLGNVGNEKKQLAVSELVMLYQLGSRNISYKTLLYWGRALQ